MAPEVDYAALAQAHGGTPVTPAVDYAALAQQHGGRPIQPPTVFTSNEKDAQGNAVVRGVSRAWDVLNTPLIPQIVDAAHAIADYVDAPKLDRTKTEAQVRGLMAGLTEGSGNVLASFTSPVGIALTLAGFGEGSAVIREIPALKNLFALPAVKALQRAVQTTSGAAFATHGAIRTTTAPTLAEKAQGVAEMAAGAAGTLAGVRSGRPTAAAPVTRLSPAEVAANQFALQHDIPLDAATATGSRFVRGVQKTTGESLLGSLPAERTQARQAAGLTRVGGELADQAHPSPVTPETAGEVVRQALTAKVEAHTKTANEAYDTLRQLEEQPTNRMTMPGKPAPVDGLPEGLRGQLRRIVHELDAAPYTPRLLKPTQHGGSLEHVPGTGGAGAKVFDDIVGRMSEGANPTRGVVQNQIEAYVAGGPLTSAVKAAIEVATERSKGQGGRSVSVPEMPPSAMDIPTRLEAGRTRGVEMGFPVNLTDVKKALQPVYDQMRRQMPITQQQANPGLKAIQNILEGDDYAALSQVDRDLSAIKKVAREQGGLAKFAVSKLEAAVQDAVKFGGPDVAKALEVGRQATRAKYAAAKALEAMAPEGVSAYRQLTAPKDTKIGMLRTVTRQTPQVAPQIARAYLEDLLTQATERNRFDHADRLYAEWQKLGTETKRILFPQPGQRQALDHFFLLAKRLAENPNPSGTAPTLIKTGEIVGLLTHPLATLPATLSMGALSKLLYTPRGVQALTRLMAQVPRAATSPAALRAVAQTAGWAEVVAAARAAGVPLDVPRAAANTPETEQTR